MQSELTLEQQFKLKVLENHIQGLSQEQAHKLLLRVIRLNMQKNNRRVTSAVNR